MSPTKAAAAGPEIEVISASAAAAVRNDPVSLAAAIMESVSVNDTTGAMDLEMDPHDPDVLSRKAAERNLVDEKAEASLEVYDIAGRRVATLVDETLRVGTYTETWDGRCDDGRKLSSGVYLYRITVDGESLTRKMVLSNHI